MNSSIALLETYQKYVGESEAPPVFHRWAFLLCLSAALGRNVHATMNGSCIYPNEYAMLMGAPGTRKSTAIKGARKLLELSKFNFFSANQTSKEQFYVDLASVGELDLNSVSRAFICADEFNNFIGEKNTGFVSGLMELYDAGDLFESKSKHGKSASVSFPTVSILGGNTHANFTTAFSPSIIHNGFLSRMLLIFGAPSGKRLPWGGTKDKDLELLLVAHLAHLQENLSGALKYTPGSKHAMERIYDSWEPIEDTRFDYYAQRRHTHLIKLATILACGAGTLLLQEADVVLANTILSAAEDAFAQALGEFGKSRFADEASLIMSELYKHGKTPTESQDLYRAVQGNLEKFDTFREIMIALVSSKKIIQVGTGYVAAPPKKRRSEYVDVSLLKTV